MQPKGGLTVRMVVSWAGLLGGAIATSAWLMVRTTLGAPLVFVGLLWSAVLGYAAWRSRRRPGLRRCCLSLAAFGLAWALAEATLVISGRAIPRTDQVNGPLLVPDPVLGWSLAKSRRVQVRKTRMFERIYETTYTLDDHGQRSCPQPTGDGVIGTVSFFGGSFTMGTGVADGLTLPCQFQEVAGRQGQIYNWGVARFGPHHMLRAFEAGLVEQRVDTSAPHIAIYQALVEHCQRIQAPGWMGFFEPAYVTLPSGDLALTETKQPPPSTVRWSVQGIWSRSLLLNGLWPSSYQCDARDLRLMVDLISESRRRLRRSYAQSELLVLLWDTPASLAPTDLTKQLLDLLTDRSLPVVRISDILGDVTEPSRFFIPQDGHPTGSTHRRIAQALAEVVTRLDLNRPSSSGAP